ncbi:hypothetical protein C6560_09250 [Enterobacter sp. FS01]|nr:hypothetical protein C6560_09250 [Enterobacter sp. FS01]HCN98388.1 hypothetical protein [Leclercia sp.]
MDIGFCSSPFGQDKTKFHAKFISVPAIDPLLTSCVVFPAYRNSNCAIRASEGKRLPIGFSGA